MKALHFFLILILPFVSKAQVVNICIGNKKIPLEITEYANVLRTTKDTILIDKKNKLSNFNLGTNSVNTTVKPSEIKHLQREIHSERGLLWTTVINDSTIERTFRVTRLSDSPFVYKTPVFKIDTVTQINPITLEEMTVVVKGDELDLKYNLGGIKKQDLINAVRSSFQLPGQSNFRIKSFILMFIKDSLHYEDINVDYHYWKESSRIFTNKVQDLPKGTAVILMEISPENTNERDLHRIGIMALMKLED